MSVLHVLEMVAMLSATSVGHCIACYLINFIADVSLTKLLCP